jgi:hypothetical protein
MRIRISPRHADCRHAAHGTVLEPGKLERCAESLDRGGVCHVLVWEFFDIGRRYCDRCIIHGELLVQQQGLDVGTFCQRMGVKYGELRDANPGQLL